jgi:hypothetical protein
MLALSSPDPALGLPAGTILQPKVFVRNTSTKTYNAHIRFNWRSAAAAGKTAPIDLPLKPNATQAVDVAALVGGPPLTMRACTVPTGGAPSLRFLARVGGDAACAI